MKVDLEEIEPCVKRISIEISTKEVEEKKNSAYREIAKTANIPGFRKGHVPRKVLEKMYEDRVHGDIAQRMVQDAFQETLATHKIKPVGEPKISEVNIDAGAPITFTATLEVFPDLAIEGLEDMTFTRKYKKADDEAVLKILEQYRERSARFESVEGRKVEEGDFAMIDYSGTSDGKELEHFKGENRQVEVTRGDMMSGFYEQIIGMQKGEEKEFSVNLPDDFPDEKLKGAPVDFVVKLNEIRVKTLPEIDDEFAKEVSEFDTLDEFKTDIKRIIEEQYRSSADFGVRKELIERLIEDLAIDLPPGLVKKQANSHLDRAKKAAKSEAGGDKPEKEAGADNDKPDESPEDGALREKSRLDAVRSLKEQAIISCYGMKEGLEVTEAEINHELAGIARMLNQTLDATKDQLGRGEQLEGITAKVFTDKVYEDMLSKVTIEDQIIEDTDDK